jgi:hypothetical protein
MREMCYLDALDYLANEIVKEYTIEEKEQLAYDTVYTHLESNFSSLLAKAQEHNIIVTKD